MNKKMRKWFFPTLIIESGPDHLRFRNRAVSIARRPSQGFNANAIREASVSALACIFTHRSVLEHISPAQRSSLTTYANYFHVPALALPRRLAMHCTRLSFVAPLTKDEPRIPNLVVAVGRVLTRPLSDGLNLTEHFIAGAAAASAAVTAMHPLDTIKTVVQAAGSKSTSAVGALGTMLRTDGLPALYKGLPISLSGQVPSSAIKFAAFETFTQFARKVIPRHATNAVVDFTCAAMAFVCCSIVVVPSELMKQRMQAGMYSSVWSGVKAMMVKEGPRAFLTGYKATLVRDVPYTMLEFGLYSQFKRLIRVLLRRSSLTSREEIIIGGVAGGCTGFLTTPLDLAKTRLMTQASTGAAVAKQYSGITDVLMQVVRKEGVPGLFKGSLARTAWLVPFTALYFGVHEASKRALLQRKLTGATAKKLKEP